MFDLDGTLVDSRVDITNSLNYAVEPYGLEQFSVEETVSMIGEGLVKLVEKAVGEGRRAIVPDVLDRFIDYYSGHLTDNTAPYPGVLETLDRVPCRKAVISNKRESLSRKLLEDLAMSRYFDLVLGSDSTEEKKPSPMPLLYVLKRFSVRPEKAMIVGDSNYDIEAGKAAGVITVAVSYGYRGIEYLKGADAIIDSFGELTDLVSKYSG